ncbi:bacterial self-protective colicin-like immunity [Komagataeibacter europaeus]|uniref:Bacterial self-protective colicin-like immunity n=1 Tax=Komagataeibacter europaeus TaxID=33995 RepID=A0A0M0EE68_KOMEU|nr:colicin immunity domain-containing protein [Komagataeibacter europaeus]KON63251.1 bacterial self-protective colicin-like immunity [Komagataeibacter europaeus]
MTIKSNILKEMIKLCEDRIINKINPSEFVDKYISLWKIARDSGNFDLNHNDRSISSAFDSIFTAADSYEPIESERSEYEIGDEELDNTIISELKIINKIKS